MATDGRQDAFDVIADQGDAEQGLTPERLLQLGIEIPGIPGDVSVCGDLPEHVVRELIAQKRYAAWLYIESASSEHYLPHVFGGENSTVELVAEEWARPVPASDAQADAVVEAIDRLPRPLMVQCRTGGRASAALAYWLARRRGYSAASLLQLAEDADLKVFTRCTVCGPVKDWLLSKLGGQTTAEPGAPAAALTTRRTGDLIFVQLFDPASCTLTYLLGSQSSKTCLLLDPVLEQKERDLMLVDELGLSLKYVVNTHCHADHITSGSAIRAERPEVRTVISRASGACADMYIEEGDILDLGGREADGSPGLRLKAIATPGHTDGCVCFHLEPTPPASERERPHEAMIFTGDTLLIRGCGRTDFQHGDSARLYQNVQSKIFTLPETTLVFPAHDYKGRTVSSVGEEKKYNPRLTKSQDEFVTLMSELSLPYPKKMDVAVLANMQCGVQD
eukprot:TRINITY_DN31491_c0_g1_i1.p1 TRINITY_DN31491_c0_g1~~TRINITY_DN31491_c0_g1_i1.p1  ORF type:complete len:478 (+),score=64.88 TRINITY_DN31491_c0_g1_i1:88-1434(+)